MGVHCWDAYDFFYKKPLLQDQESQTNLQIHRNKNSKSGKMKWQRNIFQMKKQDKTPEKELR